MYESKTKFIIAIIDHFILFFLFIFSKLRFFPF